MRRIFKLCQFPKCGSRNFAIQIVLDIIVNRIICHRSFHNIIFVWNSSTTCHNKIQPFFRHLFKIQTIQSTAWNIFIFIDVPITVSGCPTLRLLCIKCAVKSKIEIFLKTCFSNLGIFHDFFTPMI